MLKNYLKIALRNLFRNKVYSFINITGLALGMAVATLIGLWIHDELSFNADNRNYEKIALINKNRTYNGNVYTETSQSLPLAAELKNSYGNNFEKVVASSYPGEHSIKYGEKSILKRALYMEDGGQDILDLKVIAGSLNQTIDPFNILISQSTAQNLFNKENPIGKIVWIDDKTEVKIAGIYKDFPFGSTFKEIGFYGSMKLYESTDLWVKNSIGNWDVNSFPIYVKILPNSDFEQVSAKIRKVVFEHTKDDTKPELFLYPMSKWHLFQEFKDGKNIGNGIGYLWLFGSIGIFVLILACINFMNLSTARSEKRAREIGVRKAIGSLRSQLIMQFYVESFLITFLGVLLSLAVVCFSLPWFNELVGKHLVILWQNRIFWSLLIVFSGLTGILAGSYPALYLSSFDPIRVLKGVFLSGKHSSAPRKILVVIQFGVSITLIIATIIVYQQIQFAKNRPIGYDADGLIHIQKRSPSINAHYEALQKELLDSGGIIQMSQSSGPTTESWFSSNGFQWKGKDPDFKEDFVTLTVTPEFGKTAGWKLVQGRDFSRQFSTDSNAIILNESALKIVGKANPLNENIVWEGKTYQIIGVVKDLLIDSPYEGVKPMVFTMRIANMNFMNMRLNPQLSISQAISRIKPVFEKYNPSEPFDFRFVSDQHNFKFRMEERVARLSVIFSFLAILISCLGIFGLAGFMAEQRTKEIGVRKVLGASVFNLWSLLSKDFVMLVVVSLFVSIPTAYYFMSNWLQKYEYRTAISGWVFVVSSFGVLLITLLTVSFQAIKAALANPVKSLKTE